MCASASSSTHVRTHAEEEEEEEEKVQSHPQRQAGEARCARDAHDAPKQRLLLPGMYHPPPGEPCGEEP